MVTADQSRVRNNSRIPSRRLLRNNLLLAWANGVCGNTGGLSEGMGPPDEAAPRADADSTGTSDIPARVTGLIVSTTIDVVEFTTW
jgi:hypothetical protein